MEYKLIMKRYGPDKKNPTKKVVYSSSEQMFDTHTKAAAEAYKRVYQDHVFDEFEIKKLNTQPNYDRD